MSVRHLSLAQMIESLETGGAENLAVQIANAHAAAGHFSTLYVLSKPAPMANHLRHVIVVAGPLLHADLAAGCLGSELV